MQPMDPLSQLAMCCGLGNRRRQLKPPGNTFFYSPSHAAHLNHHHHESNWALANNYAPHAAAPQPYLLLNQPVIIANATNAGLNQTNMTLLQHAQLTQPGYHHPYFTMLGSPHRQQQLMHHQPSIVSSQYAIYNMQTAATSQQASGLLQAPMPSIQEIRKQASPAPAPTQVAASQNIYSNPKALQQQQQQQTVGGQSATHQIGAELKVATLSSDVFRQLEVIEKQIDLSADMETVEKYGIVMTRALDPYSLMPHLTESILREYNEQYLHTDGFCVKFVEIIKRPGQTLGLYIRTIRFEDTQGRGSRAGVVITKIDIDSPIYNSSILHVGDEIISVNLVDVNGMSLDNVVVIMSIPKRLVLALRVPRDRLLSMDFMQQQQQQHQLQVMRDHQREVATTSEGSGFMERPPGAQSAASFNNDYRHYQQFASPQTTFDNQLRSDIKQPVISSIRLGDTPEQSSYFSSSIDAINRELKELRRQRMALSNNEQNLDSTRVDF